MKKNVLCSLIFPEFIHFYYISPRKCKIMFAYLFDRRFSIEDWKTKKLVVLSQNVKTGGKREKN